MTGIMTLGHNTLVVLLGCAALGLAAGVVGGLALLRGRALLADALGHAALPGVVGAALLVAALAPLSLALGLPFPLGLDRFQQEGPALLPWAWALNGAFSVVATPLASLLGHGMGLSWLLAAGMICYTGALLSWPRKRP